MNNKPVHEQSMLDLLARSVGEIAGLIVKPVDKKKVETETVSRKETVEERKVSETVIVRRTVIEEVEIKREVK